MHRCGRSPAKLADSPCCPRLTRCVVCADQQGNLLLWNTYAKRCVVQLVDTAVPDF